MTTTHEEPTMRLIQIRADELAELEVIAARQASEPGDWPRVREILADVRADDGEGGTVGNVGTVGEGSCDGGADTSDW
jgi:hypothetical protein